MSDLDALAAEAAGQLGAGDTSETAADAGVTVSVNMDAMVKAMAMGTIGATAAAFKARDLAPLTVDEGELLMRAMLDLAAAYGLLDVSKLSPRVAAWFNLGTAVIAIAAPRIVEARERAAQGGDDLSLAA